MRALHVRLAWTGLFFAAVGLLSLTGGCLGMLRFFRNARSTDDYTVPQLLRGLVGPHALMLFGIALAVYGIILVVRGALLKRRIAAEARDQ